MGSSSCRCDDQALQISLPLEPRTRVERADGVQRGRDATPLLGEQVVRRARVALHQMESLVSQ